MCVREECCSVIGIGFGDSKLGLQQCNHTSSASVQETTKKGLPSTCLLLGGNTKLVVLHNLMDLHLVDGLI